MSIDSHAHIVPPTTLEALRSGAGNFPSIDVETVDQTVKFTFAGKTKTRPVMKGLWDIDDRRSWMEATHISHQVNGTWLDMTGYEIPADEGKDWSRFINEGLRDLAKSQPEFVTLASVPMQSGMAAAEILNEALDQGFPGVMIGTQPKGKGGVLDDPDLEPFWQTASDRRAVIVIHPMYDCGDDRVHDYGLANGLGRITDTVITVARMLFAGMPGRYPGARIVVPIGGAALPFVLGRLKRTREIGEDSWAHPEEQLAHLWVDTVVHDADTLDFVAKKVRWEKIMLGTDKPFPIGDFSPEKIIDELDLDAGTRAQIVDGNARTLFGIA